MHHAPAAQVLHPHRGFEPMSQLQHGLSSYAANVKETTGLFANYLTSTLLELLRIIQIVICGSNCHSQCAWTRYGMLMDIQVVHIARESLSTCTQPGPVSCV